MAGCSIVQHSGREPASSPDGRGSLSLPQRAPPPTPRASQSSRSSVTSRCHRWEGAFSSAGIRVPSRSRWLSLITPRSSVRSFSRGPPRLRIAARMMPPMLPVITWNADVEASDDCGTHRTIRSVPASAAVRIGRRSARLRTPAAWADRSARVRALQQVWIFGLSPPVQPTAIRTPA
jgi:hypothetical protein